MKPKTNKEVCAAYQSRKRERTVAADRRRLAARARSQSKREQPSDPAAEVAAWSAKRLKVPVGHDREGQPMELPRFAVRFLEAVLEPECFAGYLLVSRKNSKSASLACLVLAHLADGAPLRQPGFRCAIVSITKVKAAELKQQCQDIAEASGLRGLTFKKSPAPGRIESRWGSCEVLSAADYEGHASGFNLVLIDELGLLPERFRGLIAGLRSSLVAKRGRMVCLSIMGDSPFTQEAIALKGHPGIVVHHYAGLEGCEIDDPKQLEAANPGISAGILRLEDLVRDARLAKRNPADQTFFRAHHLNQQLSSSKELIVTVDDWKRCLVSPFDLPPREGRCVIGLDPGGSSSLSSICILFDNQRAEFHSALPATPGLAARGQSDGVGGLYVEAERRSELRVYSGRVTNVADFLAGVIHGLHDCEIVAGASDRYRKSEVLEILEDPKTGADFEWIFSAMGSGERGSSDVRAFQKLVLTAGIKATPSLLFASGLSSAVIKRDGNSNPSLERSGRARIDLVSAAVLAAGVKSAAAGDSGWSVERRAVT